MYYTSTNIVIIIIIIIVLSALFVLSLGHAGSPRGPPPERRPPRGLLRGTKLLYSTLLYSTLLYSTLLYSTILYYAMLYYTILYYYSTLYIYMYISLCIISLYPYFCEAISGVQGCGV